MGPKKGKGKGGPVDGVDTTSMSREQLEAFSLRLREELDREREERNFFQLERDKLRTFWEITRQQLEENRAQLRNQDRAHDENEEKHQAEIKIYKQKVKHLLYEHQCNLSELKVESMVSLKMAQDEYTAMEQELLQDKKELKAKLREQELAHQEEMRQLKMEHSAEVSRLREQFSQDASELEHKYEARMASQNEELGMQHSMELGEVEQRKNRQVVELTKSHEQAFNEMKNYYNDITLNNLALISSLKEQMEELKSGHERMEKQLRDVQGENKRLVEPLNQVRAENSHLQRQLASYEQDKIALANTKQRLALVSKELEDLRWENEVLELRFEKVEKERNRLHAEFVGAVLDVQQKTGLKSAVLEKKMTEMRGGAVSDCKRYRRRRSLWTPSNHHPTSRIPKRSANRWATRVKHTRTTPELLHKIEAALNKPVHPVNTCPRSPEPKSYTSSKRKQVENWIAKSFSVGSGSTDESSCSCSCNDVYKSVSCAEMCEQNEVQSELEVGKLKDSSPSKCHSHQDSSRLRRCKHKCKKCRHMFKKQPPNSGSQVTKHKCVDGEISKSNMNTPQEFAYEMYPDESSQSSPESVSQPIMIRCRSRVESDIDQFILEYPVGLCYPQTKVKPAFEQRETAARMESSTLEPVISSHMYQRESTSGLTTINMSMNTQTASLKRSFESINHSQDDGNDHESLFLAQGNLSQLWSKLKEDCIFEESEEDENINSSFSRAAKDSECDQKCSPKIEEEMWQNSRNPEAVPGIGDECGTVLTCHTGETSHSLAEISLQKLSSNELQSSPNLQDLEQNSVSECEPQLCPTITSRHILGKKIEYTGTDQNVDMSIPSVVSNRIQPSQTEPCSTFAQETEKSKLSTLVHEFCIGVKQAGPVRKNLEVTSLTNPVKSDSFLEVKKLDKYNFHCSGAMPTSQTAIILNVPEVSYEKKSVGRKSSSSSIKSAPPELSQANRENRAHSHPSRGAVIEGELLSATSVTSLEPAQVISSSHVPCQPRPNDVKAKPSASSRKNNADRTVEITLSSTVGKMNLLCSNLTPTPSSAQLQSVVTSTEVEQDLHSQSVGASAVVAMSKPGSATIVYSKPHFSQTSTTAAPTILFHRSPAPPRVFKSQPKLSLRRRPSALTVISRPPETNVPCVTTVPPSSSSLGHQVVKDSVVETTIRSLRSSPSLLVADSVQRLARSNAVKRAAPDPSASDINSRSSSSKSVSSHRSRPRSADDSIRRERRTNQPSSKSLDRAPVNRGTSDHTSGSNHPTASHPKDHSVQCSVEPKVESEDSSSSSVPSVAGQGTRRTTHQPSTTDQRSAPSQPRSKPGPGWRVHHLSMQTSTTDLEGATKAFPGQMKDRFVSSLQGRRTTRSSCLKMPSCEASRDNLDGSSTPRSRRQSQLSVHFDSSLADVDRVRNKPKKGTPPAYDSDSSHEDHVASRRPRHSQSSRIGSTIARSRSDTTRIGSRSSLCRESEKRSGFRSGMRPGSPFPSSSYILDRTLSGGRSQQSLDRHAQCYRENLTFPVLPVRSTSRTRASSGTSSPSPRPSPRRMTSGGSSSSDKSPTRRKVLDKPKMKCVAGRLCRDEVSIRRPSPISKPLLRRPSPTIGKQEVRRRPRKERPDQKNVSKQSPGTIPSSSSPESTHMSDPKPNPSKSTIWTKGRSSSAENKAVIWTKPGTDAVEAEVIEPNNSMWLRFPSIILACKERMSGRGVAEAVQGHISGPSDLDRPGTSDFLAHGRSSPDLNDDKIPTPLSGKASSPVVTFPNAGHKQSSPPSSNLFWNRDKNVVTIEEIFSDDVLFHDESALSRLGFLHEEADSDVHVDFINRLSSLHEETDSDLKLDECASPAVSSPPEFAWTHRGRNESGGRMSKGCHRKLRQHLSPGAIPKRRSHKAPEDDSVDAPLPRTGRILTTVKHSVKDKQVADSQSATPRGSRTPKVRFSDDGNSTCDVRDQGSRAWDELQSAIQMNLPEMHESFTEMQSKSPAVSRSLESAKYSSSKFSTSSATSLGQDRILRLSGEPEEGQQEPRVRTPTKILVSRAKSTASMTGIHEQRNTPVLLSPTDSMSKILRPSKAGKDVMVVELYRKPSEGSLREDPNTNSSQSDDSSHY